MTRDIDAAEVIAVDCTSASITLHIWSFLERVSSELRPSSLTRTKIMTEEVSEDFCEEDVTRFPQTKLTGTDDIDDEGQRIEASREVETDHPEERG